MGKLTDRAIATACNADLATTQPWNGLTRHETAVGLTLPPTLHGWKQPFDLWESVYFQGFHRRHMEGQPS